MTTLTPPKEVRILRQLLETLGEPNRTFYSAVKKNKGPDFYINHPVNDSVNTPSTPTPPPPAGLAGPHGTRDTGLRARANTVQAQRSIWEAKKTPPVRVSCAGRTSMSVSALAPASLTAYKTSAPLILLEIFSFLYHSMIILIDS